MGHYHNKSEVVPVGDDFLSTFIASFSVIIVSEIGMSALPSNWGCELVTLCSGCYCVK
jgi:hypothetical protein